MPGKAYTIEHLQSEVQGDTHIARFFCELLRSSGLFACTAGSCEEAINRM